METILPESTKENVCDFKYLTELMGGKKKLITEIMDAFVVQIQEELTLITEAINIKDYLTIRKIAHSMKSSVSIMGISLLTPILKELETQGVQAIDIETIDRLNVKLVLICNAAIVEIEIAKAEFV